MVNTWPAFCGVAHPLLRCCSLATSRSPPPPPYSSTCIYIFITTSDYIMKLSLYYS